MATEASWKASAAKLPADGLWLNTSKSEYRQSGGEGEREDNWLVAAKRSQRHCLWILRCRAFLSLNRRSPTVSGCSPANRERELAVDHREEGEREREGGGGEEGIRKDTAGIIGLWQPSVHSDVAFGSFDVGPSYH